HRKLRRTPDVFVAGSAAQPHHWCNLYSTSLTASYGWPARYAGRYFAFSRAVFHRASIARLPQDCVISTFPTVPSALTVTLNFAGRLGGSRETDEGNSGMFHSRICGSGLLAPEAPR